MSDTAQNNPVSSPVMTTPAPKVQPSVNGIPTTPTTQTSNDNNQASVLMDAIMANHATNGVSPTIPVGGRRKEVLATPLPISESPAQSAEVQPVVESPAVPEQSANQPAEYEAAQAELEPTIEKLQAEIEQNKMKAPEQIAVRQDNAQQTVPKTVAQPVVILPLTEQKMQEGEKKSPDFSVRWLVAWAKRQVKKFKDILVVYRDSSYNQDK